MRYILKGWNVAVDGEERGTEYEIVTDGMSGEEIYARCARMGMERKGVVRVRAEGDEGVEMAVLGYCHGAFRFSREGLKGLGRRGDEPGYRVYGKRDLLCDYGEGRLEIYAGAEMEGTIRRAAVMARCEGYARALGDLPHNYLRTGDMAAYIGDMAADAGLKAEILGEEELKKLGCGGILAVNQASGQQARLAVLDTRGADEHPVALVGKGVMFDCGGYHLKDPGNMDGMHMDMCGAAAAVCAMEYLARVGAARRVVAVVPMVENLLGPEGVKMGDVITTMSGKTVEVNNTDAEGRLILCDALTYAQRLGARQVVDAATLTNGARAALGDECGAFFTNREEQARRVEEAAKRMAEAMWRMPLDERYHRALRWSLAADLANYAPGKGAAASMAACFLEEFIEEGTVWTHIDMLGPSRRRGGCDWECEGATGFGMRTMAELAR